MPEHEGEEVVVTYQSRRRIRPLATLRATGKSLGRSLFDLKPLRSNDVPDFDPTGLEIIEMVFG
jgi:hypothetical protein